MTRRIRPNRLPLLASGLLVTGALMSGCGFNYATDRVNTISAGVNDRDGVVDVLGAVVIAGEDNAGVFAATLVNNDLDAEVALVSIDPPSADAPPAEEETEAEPVAYQAEPGDLGLTVAAGGTVSLFNADAVPVEGAFTAGDFVTVTLRFDNEQVTTMQVNVVVPCRQYSPDELPGLALPGGEEPVEEAPVDEEAHADEEHAEELPDRYSCEAAHSPLSHGGEE